MQWRTLDKARREIRVLDLYAGINTSPLGGHLRHVSLDVLEKPLHETISYAWGDATLAGHILVDGDSINIPASAVFALQCMRLPDKPRALWIDCICIDQRDEIEKNHQVALMPDIYNDSQQTLSYIGEDDGTVAEVFEGIKLMHRVLTHEAKGSIELSQLHHMEVRRADLSRLQGMELAIRRILTRPYFSRLWVVQEVTLSTKTTIYCGALPLDFDAFVVTARWLLCHSDGRKILGTHLRRDVHEAMLPAASSVTLVVLSRMNVLEQHHFCVSEPRDRVYELLGLLKQLQRTSSLHPSLDPDYNKPIADVYRDATRTSALGRGDLRQIENEGYERQSYTKIDSLPSWVPNWYCRRTGRWELDAPDRLPVTPIALLAWPGRIGSSWLGDITADENVLSIRGVVLTATMAHSGAVITRKDLATLSQKAIHDFVSRAYALHATHNRSGSITYCARLNHALTAGRLDVDIGEFCCMCVAAPALCRLHLQPQQLAAFAGLPATMVAVRSAIKIADLLADEHDEAVGRGPSGTGQTSAGTSSASTISQTGTSGKRKVDRDVSSRQSLNVKRRVEERASQHLTLIQCLDNSFRARTKDLVALTSARRHLRTALRFNVNCKIFLTKCGHIGIGPQGLQDDDILAVSELSKWPFVLRRVMSASNSHYAVVGSAYVEGVDEVMASCLEMRTIQLV